MNIGKNKLLRRSTVVLLEVFAVITLIRMAVEGDVTNLLMCIATIGLILIPEIVEKIFSCKINTVLYLIGVFYAIGPMLGDCYKLYYLTSWWDKLLHTLGGVVFAMFGVYLFELLTHKNKNIFACAVFALCFSIALSACWEFVEFGSDLIFHTDMQQDTLLSGIHSYRIGEELGIVGHIDQVEGVLIDGSVEISGGYLDIGLYDSMTDMVLESLGAFVFFVVFLMDKGRHPLFISNKEDKSSMVILDVSPNTQMKKQ